MVQTLTTEGRNCLDFPQQQWPSKSHRDAKTPCGEHPMRCPQRPQALLQQLLTFQPTDQRKDHQGSRVSGERSVREGNGVSRRATSGGSLGEEQEGLKGQREQR